MKLTRFYHLSFQCIVLILALFTIVSTSESQDGGTSGLLPAQSAPASPRSDADRGTKNPAFFSPAQDPEAMSILNEVLAAGGGAKSISAVSDYTATGRVIAAGQESRVTIRGRYGWEFRMDVSGPAGTHSSGVHEGKVFEKAEGGAVSMPQKSSGQRSRFAPPVWTPMFPAGFAFQTAFVAHVVNMKNFEVSYIGATEINGHIVHDIRITAGPFSAASQRGNSDSVLRYARELFVDTSTFQIVAFREVVPRNAIHEVAYADYRLVEGVLMPLKISESLGGHPIADIEIDRIEFNTGLQPAAFAAE
jgi:hypothetical protein